MSQPLVSVVTPAYNAEKWIAEAIRSVQAQTWPAWEMIVVNDGSKDATAEVARSIGDPRVRVIDKPNGGVSSARNAGIDAAAGECIAFLDADDAFEPGCLEKKVRALQAHGADWAFSDILDCDPELRPRRAPVAGADGDWVRIILSGSGDAVPGAASNLLCHRRCFADGLRFDPGLSNAADKDMVLSLASRFKGVRVPEPLVRYRAVPGSMSRNIALHEHDQLGLLRNAIAKGLLNDRRFRRHCLALNHWNIGGSWWVNARRPMKALPWLLRAAALEPMLLARKLAGRLKA